jgi:hypothetical protein
MTQGDGAAQFALRPQYFGEKEREAARFGDLSASLFRYDTGIEAVRLRNPRGEVVVLPYLGQIVWSATFDAVDLAMRSMFAEPRPAASILDTYGCLAYHSGILRNGVPGEGDSHAVHGEAPVARMDSAALVCGQDERGRWMMLKGSREYAMGFGAHYLATPSVRIRDDAATVDIVMEVTNLSAASTDLMYMCHVNFAFCEGGRIVQGAPFTPEHVVTRTAIPRHVTATRDYRTLVATLAADPSLMERLDEPERYDPEQVFYIEGVKPAADGLVRYALSRREGDAFTIAWDQASMPHAIRWVLVGADQQVAAIAMPATCEPEGYTAEKRKGHVRTLAGGATARFETFLEYVEAARAGAVLEGIEGSRS